MSLRVAVATPFRQQGTDRLDEHEFVVALSLDRDWFSPDQAKRLADVAVGEGLVDRDGAKLLWVRVLDLDQPFPLQRPDSVVDARPWHVRDAANLFGRPLWKTR